MFPTEARASQRTLSACCELARSVALTNGSFEITSTRFLSSEFFASLRGGIEPVLTGLRPLNLTMA